METLKAYVVVGPLPVKQEAGEDAARKLAEVAIKEAEIEPCDPFIDGFGGFRYSGGQEKVHGYIFFARSDAEEIVRRASAPIRRRIEQEARNLGLIFTESQP